MLCDYGCNKKANFTLKNGKHCCSKRPAGCDVLKKINSDGVALSHSEGRHGYTYNPASAWSKGKTKLDDARISSKYDPTTLFTYGEKNLGSIVRKQTLIKERSHRCESCKLDVWLENPITLELDHIDGDNKNNVKENLRLLCPNCHSRTPTWRKRKFKNGQNAKHSEDVMLVAIKESTNMNEVLKRLNLKWGSSSTIARLMLKYNLNF
jgi:hypothetical protein